MRLFVRLIGITLFLAGVTVAQEPPRASQPPARTMVIDLDVLDVNVDLRGEIERIVRDKRSLDRMIADGKVRPIAGIQVRARSGEQASAHHRSIELAWRRVRHSRWCGRCREPGCAARAGHGAGRQEPHRGRRTSARRRAAVRQCLCHAAAAGGSRPYRSHPGKQ